MIQSHYNESSVMVLLVRCTPGDLWQSTIFPEMKACAGGVGKGGDESPQRLKGSLSHLKVEKFVYTRLNELRNHTIRKSFI